MRMRIDHIGMLLLAALALASCNEDPVPKPKGWLRLDLPEKSYATWVDERSFSAELPAYARMVERRSSPEARWYDLRFPGQRATMHLTWSRVNGDLNTLIEDAHIFKEKHEVKAARIGRERVLRPEDRVFGTLFDVDGDVASPMVFYLTDSTSNFLYGALYFDSRPNADSLAPVTARIREDMRHVSATLRWAGR